MVTKYIIIYFLASYLRFFNLFTFFYPPKISIFATTMYKNLSEIEANMKKFVSDSSNYANYGSEIKAIEGFFTTLYDAVPRRYLALRYVDEKYELTHYYDTKSTTCVEKEKVIKYDDLVAFIRSKIELLELVYENETTYLITQMGMFIAAIDSDNGELKRIKLISMDEESERKLSEILLDMVSVVPTDSNKGEKNHYKIAYIDEGSIETMTSEFDDWSSNIKQNYNDDIPYDEMNENIRADKSSLMLLYGDPGTGKSSLIKSLINDNLNSEFIYMDSSLFVSLSNGQFLSFLNDHRGATFILEDCEKALQSRDEGNNDSISTILNITDGIVAESLKCKFICTFNCKKSKIDTALLRKGRLSILYEFKKLSLEKTKALYPEATKEMTLADIYNAATKVDYTEKEVRKIGF